MPQTVQEIYELLESVKDPEVPALSIVDLGIVRDVRFIESGVEVVITPTYSGCPALATMQEDVKQRLLSFGIPQVKVSVCYAPAWTTDWISEAGKTKLKEFGIAPPVKVVDEPLISIGRAREAVPCPFCDSKETKTTSDFGSTACKSLHFCNSCQQPFEYFKPF